MQWQNLCFGTIHLFLLAFLSTHKHKNYIQYETTLVSLAQLHQIKAVLSLSPARHRDGQFDVRIQGNEPQSVVELAENALPVQLINLIAFRLFRRSRVFGVNVTTGSASSIDKGFFIAWEQAGKKH